MDINPIEALEYIADHWGEHLENVTGGGCENCPRHTGEGCEPLCMFMNNVLEMLGRV